MSLLPILPATSLLKNRTACETAACCPGYLFRANNGYDIIKVISHNRLFSAVFYGGVYYGSKEIFPLQYLWQPRRPDQ